MTPVHQKLGMGTVGLAQVDGGLTQPAAGCFVTAGRGHHCVLGMFDGEGGQEVGWPGTQSGCVLPEAEQPEGSGEGEGVEVVGLHGLSLPHGAAIADVVDCLEDERGLEGVEEPRVIEE